MYKKISILLMIVLIMGSLTIPSTVHGDSISNLTSQEKAEVLKELELLKGIEGDLALERVVTRAEGLTMILRLLGEENIAKAHHKKEGIFKDIPISHWAYNSINYGVEKGYIEGIEEDRFSPDTEITEEEFIRALLSARGYEGSTLENPHEKALELGFISKELMGDKDKKRFLRKRMVDISYELALSNKESFPWKLNRLMPKDKNYMFSPLSIKMALAMAATGSDGKTKEEILSTLNIENLDDFMEYSKKIIEEYSENDKVALNIANSIWLNTDYYPGVDFSNTFEKAIVEYFNGTSSKVRDKDAVEKINHWVNEKTQGKIEKITDNSSFLSYIVNAIYFKGEWANQFQKGATRPDDFTDKNGNVTEIDFMNKTAYYDYYGDDDLKIIRLPYKDGKTSMYIALPEIANLDLVKYIKEMKRTNVALSLPKFKTELSIKLGDVLKDLGIIEAFDPSRADFKSMFTKISENVFISDVVHKTFIEVDEEGTEAAAVTGIEMTVTSMPMPMEPVIFKADRPFTYFIYDDVNEEILFMGEQSF